MAVSSKRNADEATLEPSVDGGDRKAKRSKKEKVKKSKSKSDKIKKSKKSKKDKTQITEVEVGIVEKNASNSADISDDENPIQETDIDREGSVDYVQVSNLDEEEAETLRQWEAEQMAVETLTSDAEAVEPEKADLGQDKEIGKPAKDGKKAKKEKKFKGVSCPFKNCTEVFKTMKPHGIYACTTHEDKKSYACMVKSCTKAFINTKRLRVHFKAHKDKEREHLDCQCPGCVGRSGLNSIKTSTIDTTPLLGTDNNDSSNLKASVKKHGEDVTCTGTDQVALKCPYTDCAEVFTVLKPHGVYKCTTGKTKECYNCIVHGCGEVFVNTKQLKQHVARHTCKEKLDCKCHLCLVRSALKVADSAARKTEDDLKDKVSTKDKAKKTGPVKTDLTVQVEDNSDVSDDTGSIGGVKVDCPHPGCEETFALTSHRKYRCKTTEKHPVVRVCFVAECGKAFTDNLQMKEHVKVDHNKDGKIESLVCDCCSCEKLYADLRVR